MAPSTTAAGSLVGQPNCNDADPSDNTASGADEGPPGLIAICATAASGRSNPSEPRTNFVDGARQPPCGPFTLATFAVSSAMN